MSHIYKTQKEARPSKDLRPENSVHAGFCLAARLVTAEPLFFFSDLFYYRSTKKRFRVATVDGVTLEFALASANVAEYVSLFYRFRTDLPLYEDTERADHPQLRMHLIPASATQYFPDGNVQTSPALHFFGPTTGASHFSLSGPVDMFGMGLTPLGWATLVGNDASTMANRIIDAVEILGEPIKAVAAELEQAADLDAMVVIFEKTLRDMIAAPSPERAFIRHVDAWLTGHPSPTIDTLVAETGLSSRQLERKCKALYGAPPKLLARKYRAVRAAVAMVSDGVTPPDAIERGFYDQSHLIREIKHFTGLTPGQIHTEPNLLAQLTISQRRALGDKVPLILSHT